jgi:hypothetical protein
MNFVGLRTPRTYPTTLNKLKRNLSISVKFQPAKVWETITPIQRTPKYDAYDLAVVIDPLDLND